MLRGITTGTTGLFITSPNTTAPNYGAELRQIMAQLFRKINILEYE